MGHVLRLYVLMGCGVDDFSEVRRSISRIGPICAHILTQTGLSRNARQGCLAVYDAATPRIESRLFIRPPQVGPGLPGRGVKVSIHVRAGPDLQHRPPI